MRDHGATLGRYWGSSSVGLRHGGSCYFFFAWLRAWENQSLFDVVPFRLLSGWDSQLLMDERQLQSSINYFCKSILNYLPSVHIGDSSSDVRNLQLLALGFRVEVLQSVR
jgi:hypothetical protein